MFSIQISDTSGDERHETFETEELSLGRVQGNDLMLPRGNVSKHHARLVHREGRFILTDLKSTNGTYVNGRRIGQATIVREGDIIQIGDFVLRLHTSKVHVPVSSQPRKIPMTQLIDSAPTPPTGRDWMADGPPSERARGFEAPPSVRPHPSLLSSPRSPVATTLKDEPTEYERAFAALMGRVAEEVDLSLLDSTSPLDEAFLNRLSRAIAETSRRLRESGELSARVDDAMLSRDAHRELLGLGPLGPLLEDETMTEIRLFGHDRLVALKGSQPVRIEPAFSSEAALYRVLSRLARESGRPLGANETLVERALPFGASLRALLPPSAPQSLVVLRKPGRSSLQLEDWVREGTLSRAMATFLTQAVAAGANVLVADLSGQAASVLGSLAPADGLNVALCASCGPPIPASSHCLLLPDADDEAVKTARAALRLRPSGLVVAPFAGAVAAEVMDAMARGLRSVVAAVPAASLRQALSRLAPALAAARPGLASDVAREWLAASFDLVLEVARLRDGRYRVLRIAELDLVGGSIETKDVFVFATEGMVPGGDVEGSFVATGIVPRLAEELAIREGRMDASLFKRAPGPSA